MSETEICRDIDGLKEAENKSGLFIIEEESREGKVAFFDVRQGEPRIYGYKKKYELGDTKKESLNSEEIKPYPDCVKKAKNEIAAKDHESLGEFA